MAGPGSTPTQPTQSSAPGRLRGWLANLAVLLITVLVLALGAGIATRLLADVSPPLGVRHPLLGSTYQPGFQGSVYSEESGRDILLRFNCEGFRGTDGCIAGARRTCLPTRIEAPDPCQRTERL